MSEKSRRKLGLQLGKNSSSSERGDLEPVEAYHRPNWTPPHQSPTVPGSLNLFSTALHHTTHLSPTLPNVVEAQARVEYDVVNKSDSRSLKERTRLHRIFSGKVS